MPSRFTLSLRRLATRLFGTGPSGVIQPFAWHARWQHENQRRGLSQPERFTGVIASEPGEAFPYAAPRVLTREGVVENHGVLTPPATPRGIAPRVDAAVYSLSPGTVIGTHCLVYCPETRVAVEESMKLWNEPLAEHPVFTAPRFPAATRLPGTSLLIGILGVESFYHLLLECLPKVALTRPWWHRVDHFIVTGRPGSFIEKWLVHAGVPREKMKWLGDFGHFTCDQLLFTGMLTRHHYTTPPIVKRLHTLWPRGELAQATRKIWITRRTASTRHIQWEEALLKQLPGFEVVDLGTLSPAEQIAVLRSARVIAGPHGAGLAGMVFAPAGAQVLEFLDTAEPGMNACFSRLSQVSGLEHHTVRIDFSRESDVSWLQSRLS